MKRLILLLLLITVEAKSQSTIRLFFEKTEDFTKQTIIAFTEETTDDVDNCCDAFLLGLSEVGIWTEINGTPYAINALSPITEDRVIPIHISSYTNDGLYLIGVDYESGEKLSYRLIDEEYPDVMFNLPYSFVGPIYENRFSLYIDRPTIVQPVSGCDFGKVGIDNDDDGLTYILYSNGELVNTYPSSTDTIYQLSNGNYQLISGEFAEVDSFFIQNENINATLWVSAQNVWIIDSYIEGVVTIYSPFDSIHWDFGDGTFVEGDQNPVHQYQSPGVYVLRVTVKRGDCQKTLETIISVQSPNGMYTPQNPVKFRAQVRSWDLAGRRLR
jgi:hypothetical protein